MEYPHSVCRKLSDRGDCMPIPTMQLTFKLLHASTCPNTCDMMQTHSHHQVYDGILHIREGYNNIVHGMIFSPHPLD